MQRIGLFIAIILLGCAVQAQTRRDSVPILEGDTLREVQVTKDKRLPLFVNPDVVKPKMRVPSVSDIIGRKATDMIMHPLAFKQRKEERRRRKAIKKLEEFARIKTNNELLREALMREGIDPDSLLQNNK